MAHPRQKERFPANDRYLQDELIRIEQESRNESPITRAQRIYNFLCLWNPLIEWVEEMISKRFPANGLPK